MRIFLLICIVLLAASPCRAQQMKLPTICVVDTNQQVRLAVERWLQTRGVQTVDCMWKDKADREAHPDKGSLGDAHLTFFANTRSVETDTYNVYTQGNTVTVLRDVFPAVGVTISLQLQREGEMMGNLFVGKMLFYGQGANLEDGLKNVCKRIHCQKPQK
jgi:hypothetical protein